MGPTLFLESAFGVWGTNQITNLWSRQQNQFQGLAAVVWSKRVKYISKNLLPSLAVFFSPDYIFSSDMSVTTDLLFSLKPKCHKTCSEIPLNGIAAESNSHSLAI